MSIYQIFAILRARRWTFVTVMAISLAIAGAILAFAPKRYQAVAQLYVDSSENDPVTGAAPSLSVMRGMIYDVMEGLRTQGVARQAVSDLGLDKDPASIAAYNTQGGEGDIRDWLANGLTSGLRVTRIGMSNILSISFEASNPETAARFANGIAQAAINKDIQMRAGPSQDLTGWYDERLKPLREQREQVLGALSKLRESSHTSAVASSAEAQASLARELSNAQVELAQARAMLEEARAGRIDVSSDPEVTQVRKQIADLEQQILQDTATFGPAHNRVKQAIAARPRLNARLQDVTQRATASATRTAEQRVGSLVQRVAEMNAMLAASKTTANAGLADMQREVETLDTQIQQLLQRRETARLVSTLNRSPLRVITDAAVPYLPSFPKIPLLGGIAIGLGLIFGLALAFVREMFDRRIRCPQDIDYLALPVLTTIPKARLRRRLFRRKRLAGRQEAYVPAITHAPAGRDAATAS